jgi:hypothetical protein
MSEKIAMVVMWFMFFGSIFVGLILLELVNLATRHWL